MKRKTSEMPTKIWTLYGRPTSDTHALDDQIYLAHRYSNKLIEIERARREAYRQASYVERPELRALDAMEADLDKRIELATRQDRLGLYEARRGIWARQKTHRSALRALLAPCDADKKKRGALRNEGKGPRTKERLNAELLDEMLAENWPDFWKVVQRSNADALAATKTSRAEFVALGLQCGSYLLADKAHEAIRRDALGTPRFRRWKQEGRAGVQIKDATVRDVLAGNSNFLQLSIRDRKRCGTTYYDAKIRIGSSGREPIWASLSVQSRGDLPLDGVVKWAWVQLSREHCTRERYELLLTIEATAAIRRHGQGFVNVAFNWQEQANGDVIAATVIDQQTGERKDVIVPGSKRRMTVYADELRGVSDALLPVGIAILTDWLAASSSAPDWCREDAKHMELWKSPRRLMRVVQRLIGELLPEQQARISAFWREWREHRRKLDYFGSATEREYWLATNVPERALALLVQLDWWRRKTLHLLGWEADQRSNFATWREYQYRLLARRLSEQYGNCVLPKTTGSKHEAETKISEVEQCARADAAPHELLRYLREAFGDRVCGRSGDAKNAVTARMAENMQDSGHTPSGNGSHGDENAA